MKNNTDPMRPLLYRVEEKRRELGDTVTLDLRPIDVEELTRPIGG